MSCLVFLLAAFITSNEAHHVNINCSTLVLNPPQLKTYILEATKNLTTDVLKKYLFEHEDAMGRFGGKLEYIAERLLEKEIALLEQKAQDPDFLLTTAFLPNATEAAQQENITTAVPKLETSCVSETLEASEPLTINETSVGDRMLTEENATVESKVSQRVHIASSNQTAQTTKQEYPPNEEQLVNLKLGPSNRLPSTEEPSKSGTEENVPLVLASEDIYRRLKEPEDPKKLENPVVPADESWLKLEWMTNALKDLGERLEKALDFLQDSSGAQMRS